MSTSLTVDKKNLTLDSYKMAIDLSKPTTQQQSIFVTFVALNCHLFHIRLR